MAVAPKNERFHQPPALLRSLAPKRPHKRIADMDVEMRVAIFLAILERDSESTIAEIIEQAEQVFRFIETNEKGNGKRGTAQ